MNFSQITKAPYQIRGILNQEAVTWRTAWLILLAVFTTVGITNGQNTNATIRGQVLDPQGAVVTDAKVLIVNQDTGITIFRGNSDSVGAFVAPQVIPGMYEITVTAQGFRKSVLRNLVATVAQVTSVDITLQL